MLFRYFFLGFVNIESDMMLFIILFFDYFDLMSVLLSIFDLSYVLLRDLKVRLVVLFLILIDIGCV